MLARQSAWVKKACMGEVGGKAYRERKFPFQHLTLQVLSDPDARVAISVPNAVTRAKLQRLPTGSDQPEAERKRFT